MNDLRFTLVSDGSFDDALMPILTWALMECGVSIPIQPQWADLRKLPSSPVRLIDRLGMALALYPCDLIFVHRDAERARPSVRYAEIQTAALSAGASQNVPPHVAVVPVRMTEAWLLFDEALIRMAAGNPNGAAALNLPPPHRWDKEPNPKAILHQALRTASGLGARRSARLPVNLHARRVAQLGTDFSPLRALSTFRDMESALCNELRQMGM